MSTNEPTSKRKRQDSRDVPIIRSKYWLDDGNIVLQAENTQFRVHRSMLSRHSTIFEDMFLMPQPTENTENVENCPIVMLSDNAEDVEIILSIFYDNMKVHDFKNAIPTESIAAMLRLGTKYEIDYLRQEAIERLQHDFPKKRDDWIKINADSAHIKRDSNFLSVIINLAHEFSLLSILPTLYVEHATYTSLEAICLDNTLTPEARLRCILGRDNLIHHVNDKYTQCVGLLSLVPSASCQLRSHCAGGRLEAITHWDLWGIKDGDIAALNEWDDNVSLGRSKLCALCKEALKAYYKGVLKELWGNVPSFFGFPEWENLEEL